MEKINQINQVVKAYFEKNTSVSEIPAKDLMPYFITAGIFNQDDRNGLPIRNVLRALDKKNELHQIPYVYAERKIKNVNWYFRRDNSVNSSRQKATVTKIEKAKPTIKISDRDKS